MKSDQEKIKKFREKDSIKNVVKKVKTKAERKEFKGVPCPECNKTVDPNILNRHLKKYCENVVGNYVNNEKADNKSLRVICHLCKTPVDRKSMARHLRQVHKIGSGENNNKKIKISETNTSSQDRKRTSKL